jgi:hypothetical protein
MGSPTARRSADTLVAEPVTTARQLHQRWSELLEPPVFGARSLWLMWLHADGRGLPLIVPIDELPRRFDAVAARGLVQLATTIRDEQTDGGGHVALALCRPGHATVTGSDRAWADGLGRAAVDGDLGSWSLHLAAGGAVLAVIEPPWPAS